MIYNKRDADPHFKVNDIRKNEINVEYFDYANIIRDLVNMKDLCYDTIFTQEECNEIIECISTSRNYKIELS